MTTFESNLVLLPSIRMFSFVLALNKNGAIIAYPEGNSKAPEMAKLCGCKVGMGISLSLSAVGGRNRVIMSYKIRLFSPLSLFFRSLFSPS